ncbi:MAG: tetratricopeptide repeat protein [Deltaproteobacteria bacterium]|nr:tetratricopeptide repeat protein [Deltaproteobacteria bacterium]
MDIDDLRAQARPGPPSDPPAAAIGKLLSKVAGVTLLAAALIGALGGGAWFWMARQAIVSTEAHEISVAYIEHNEILAQKLGGDLSVGALPVGEVGEDEARITYTITGSKRSAEVNLLLKNTEDGWMIRSAILDEGAGSTLWLVREDADQEAGKPDPRSEHHVMRGAQLINAGRSSEGLEELNLAISIDKTNADAWYWRARAFQEAGDFPAAQTDFEQSLALNPALPDAYEGLASVLGEQDLWAEALAQLDHFVALSPDSGMAYHVRSYAQFRLDHLEEARADATRSCELGYQAGCEALAQLR